MDENLRDDAFSLIYAQAGTREIEREYARGVQELEEKISTMGERISAKNGQRASSTVHAYGSSRGQMMKASGLRNSGTESMQKQG